MYYQKQLIIFFLLLIVPSFIHGEGAKYDKSKVDSLLAQVKTAQSDSEKIFYYTQLTEIFADGDVEKANKYLSILNKLTLHDTLSNERGEYLKLCGLTQTTNGNYKTASSYFIRALKIAEKNSDYELLKSVLNNLAILNIKTRSFEQGINYFSRLVDIAEKENNREDYVAYLMNLSLAYALNGNNEEAEKNLLKLYSFTDDIFYKAVAANSLSFIYNNTGKFNKALYYGKIAVDLSLKTNRILLQLEAMTNYSNALIMAGKYDEAQKIIFQIIKISEKNKLDEQYVNAFGNLSVLYEKKKDFAKALDYRKKYSALKDSLLDANITKQINELQIKYETEKKDKKIAIRDATIARKNIVIRYTVIIVFILIVFLVITVFLYRKQRKAYYELTKLHVSSIKKEETDKRKRKSSDKLGERLSDDTIEAVFEKIDYKINEEKLFTHKNITLGKLANELNISAKYLSFVIHKKYGESFPDFINKLRVKEAAKLLIDPEYENFSIEGIADVAGFKSRSSFNIYFKKFMSVTPSFYQASAKEIIKKQEFSGENII